MKTLIILVSMLLFGSFAFSNSIDLSGKSAEDLYEHLDIQPSEKNLKEFKSVDGSLAISCDKRLNSARCEILFDLTPGTRQGHKEFYAILKVPEKSAHTRNPKHGGVNPLRGSKHFKTAGLEIECTRRFYSTNCEFTESSNTEF